MSTNTKAMPFQGRNISYNEMMTKIRRLKIFFATMAIVAVFLTQQALADSLDQTQTFFIDKDYDAKSRSSVSATLRVVSDRAYGYVEDIFWNSITKASQQLVIDQVNKILAEFDDRIYPIETSFFGSEPNPGVDGDPKITIFFAPLVENAGGYFNNSDCYALSSDNLATNQREMLYLNINLITDAAKMQTYLAHEFQHLISFNQKELTRKIVDDVWLNEARSEHVITLLGYNDIFKGSNLEKRLKVFTVNPSDSLTEWKNLTVDYGQSAIFAEYLTEHWPSVMADALKSDLVGIPSINGALKKNGYAENFTTIFRDWMIANVINDMAINSRFGYMRQDLQNFAITPVTFVSYNGDFSAVLSENYKDWQARWYDFPYFAPGDNDVLKINFDSSSLTSFEVSYLVFKKDGTVETKVFDPDYKNSALYIGGVGNDISRVILMPFKKDKLSGFEDNEPSIILAMSIDRTDQIPEGWQPSNLPNTVKPFDFGLHEGDFIRAQGDYNVYIINDFGYKRLILNPTICLMYGHLGARGCFSAVKEVSPSVRDAFVTSWYMSNGETSDGKIYKLEPTGEDTAVLHWFNITGVEFVNQGGNFNSVFKINSNEQRSFSVGASLLKI
jgi:hypothetical protein